MEHVNPSPAGAESIFARRDFSLLLDYCRRLLATRQSLSGPELARAEYLLGCALESHHRLAEALEAFLESEQQYLEAGLEREALQARLGVILARRVTQTVDIVFHEARKCLHTAEERGWTVEAAEALVLMATARRHKNSYLEVMELTQQATALLDRERDRYLYSRAASVRAWALYALGQHEEGERIAREAFDLLRGIDNPGLLRRELGHFAFQAWCKGELDRARLLTEQQLESALADRAALEVAMARYNLGIFAAQEERWAEAGKFALLAWQQYVNPQGLVLEAGILMLLCLVSIHQRKPQEALNYSQLAARSMRESGNDEASLLSYYTALAQLACGHDQLADLSWLQRSKLGFSVENQIEVRWLLRALNLIRSWDYADLLADPQSVALAGGRMAQDLQEWLSASDAALASQTNLQQVA